MEELTKTSSSPDGTRLGRPPDSVGTHQLSVSWREETGQGCPHHPVVRPGAGKSALPNSWLHKVDFHPGVMSSTSLHLVNKDV